MLDGSSCKTITNHNDLIINFLFTLLKHDLSYHDLSYHDIFLNNLNDLIYSRNLAFNKMLWRS